MLWCGEEGYAYMCMCVHMCMCVCDLVVEQEAIHVSIHMKNYVVLELSERKELAFKIACHTCFSVRQKFPVYFVCLWCVVL